MRSRKDGRSETKFEEDIKAVFVKLYSFSTSREIRPREELKELKDVVNLYPGLATELGKYPKKEQIFAVNDLAIKEIVITGGFIPVSDKPLVYAECALIAWYDLKTDGQDPLIIEFSFRYGNKKEKYSREVVQKSYALFLLIQEKMKSWIGKEDETKTGFVFGHK